MKALEETRHEPTSTVFLPWAGEDEVWYGRWEQRVQRHGKRDMWGHKRRIILQLSTVASEGDGEEGIIDGQEREAQGKKQGTSALR